MRYIGKYSKIYIVVLKAEREGYLSLNFETLDEKLRYVSSTLHMVGNDIMNPGGSCTNELIQGTLMMAIEYIEEIREKLYIENRDIT